MGRLSSTSVKTHMKHKYIQIEHLHLHGTKQSIPAHMRVSESYVLITYPAISLVLHPPSHHASKQLISHSLCVNDWIGIALFRVRLRNLVALVAIFAISLRSVDRTEQLSMHNSDSITQKA